MSLIPEAVVISGYRIPRAIWDKGIKYCEANALEDWEEFFIDMDPFGDNGQETFFGSIIHRVAEDTPTKEFHTILADNNTITSVQETFHKIFDPIYMMCGYPVPSYNQYLGCRVV